MQRVAVVVALAAACAVFGAQCFVAPAGPSGMPQIVPNSAARSGMPLDMDMPTEEASSSWSSPLAFGAALGLLAAVATTRPALAADLENGEAVFSGNCTACHAGGNNSIVGEKKLTKAALTTYDRYSVAAIIKQVTNGYGQMPAFGEKLAPDDIEDVANYVYDQATGAKW